MPKLKTKKSVLKRFRITPTGKVLRRRSGNRHLKSTKSKSNVRRSKEPVLVPKAFAKKVKLAIGNH